MVHSSPDLSTFDGGRVADDDFQIVMGGLVSLLTLLLTDDHTHNFAGIDARAGANSRKAESAQISQS